MRKVTIAEVSLDETSRIHITPQVSPSENYIYIWRAAMSVRWDEARRSLYAIASDLDQLASYKQILKAVKDECGDELTLSEDTKWSNIPDALKSEIQIEKR